MSFHQLHASRGSYRNLVGALLCAAGLALSSCGDDKGASPAMGGGTAGDSGGAPSADAAGAGGVDASTPPSVSGEGGAGGAGGANSLCTPVRSEHTIPARRALYAKESSSAGRVMLVSELVGRFDAFCAGCHRSPAAQGDFSYTTENFRSAVPDKAAELILEQDAALRMPPSSPFPVRDDLKDLARLIQAWLEQKRPAVTFEPPLADAPVEEEGATDNPYAFDERRGAGLTNLGDCIPAAEIVGVDVDDADRARDELFAQIANFKDLPKQLKDTDLFTLDTETLARHRTVAIAPNYQLWSFDTGKLRHLRLPLGTSLQYDAAGNSFVMPPNTRLYKTFTKPVVDVNGEVGYRKIETRLIISRPDTEVEGHPQNHAVFATYIWNDDETEATLLEKPYLGTLLDDPELNTFTFKDLIKPYVTDEREFRVTLEGVDNQAGNVVLRPLPGTKEYPVPGWHRCVQCHQGSPTKNFLLGLTPTQLNRRQLGEGGSYEAAGEDELTQAQRLIDYGLISGIQSASDFIKLEDSAGERKPRNDYELRAQAYMVGNCSGCHNPRGYPTQLNPSLAFLNFLPGGSVFQFDLNQTSPLRKRQGQDGPNAGWRYVDPHLLQRPIDEAAQKELFQGILPELRSEVGPWNSLIFRNVQTPRTYDEENILFPHMPLHVAGIDCRAQAILGSWIASIPFATGKNAQGSLDANLLEDSGSAEARASADARVQMFLAQKPACEPAQDLRDWGAEAPAFTDAVPPVAIPDRPHWFEEDFTEVVGEFQPRGGEWQKDMLLDKYADIRAFEPSAELQQFVTQEVPFDFWQDKPECDFTQQRAFSGTPAAWMDPAVRPDADLQRVYSTLPGAAVFGAICSNCHGGRGTAESNLASTIAGLTGGKTRVANWSQGYFGPLSAPLTNLNLFKDQPLADGSSLGEFGAAKYLMFMALGGTEALIPGAALRQVAAARVASQTRSGNVAEFATANMLELAREVCANTIQYATNSGFPIADSYDPDRAEYVNPLTVKAVVVTTNGEYPLFNQLCAIDNPRPVRVVFYTEAGVGSVAGYLLRSAFPTGKWNGSDADPWCVDRDSLKKPAGKRVCPSTSQTDTIDVPNAFARRGVLNVGFAVYSYLKQAFGNHAEWRPGYDQCELRFLKPSATR